MNDKRGSIWRKWDIHIHTPYSYLNNEFGNDWDEYIRRVFRAAIEKDIYAIGVTDYFTIDGYKKILNEYINNPAKLSELFSADEIERIKDILILPNIEFRLHKLVGENRINFHVIFSNVLNANDIEENFLHELDFVYQATPFESEEKWKLKVNNLESLGRRLKEEHAHFRGNSDLYIGMMNAVVDDGQISKVLENKRSLFKGKYLLVLPSDEDLSQVPWDGQGHQSRKVLIQKSNILLSSNLGTIEFGLGKRSESVELFTKEFKSLKPCIWGSDAHRYQDLFEPDEQRYTWIKADPTFEGLKQILYEPECRVTIQSRNPELDTLKLKIDEFELENSNNFPIVNEIIPLNRDLVCIIGGRGSGKSALLESIAYCFGLNKGIDENNPTVIPFIQYFQDNDAQVDFIVRYNDLDNNPKDEYKTSLTSINVNCAYPVLYLSQNQVEGIATDDRKLHNLAFDSVIKNSTNAEDINLMITDIESSVTSLRKMNGEIQSIQKSLLAKGVIDLKSERNKIDKEIELLESESTRAILIELQTKGELRNRLTQSNNLIGSINEDISQFDARLQAKLVELNSLLSALGVETNVSFNLEDLIMQLKDAQSQLDKLNILNDYNQTLDKAKIELKGKLDVSVEYIEGLKSRMSEIDKSIQTFETENQYYQTKIDDRISLYSAIYNKFEEFKTKYIVAISDFMRSNYEIVQSLRLEPILSFNFQEFINKLYDYVDKRKIKSIKRFEEILNIDKSTISKFINWLEDFSKEDPANPNKFDIFYSWPNDEVDSILFTNYFSLKTIIEYKISDENYKPINKLSLGQKGTVILKLFLSIGNNCPIIIDQPEDHLDNDFIYKDLVKTFRKAKEKRQIIVSTHNANLVVNGDADQIIVANFEDEKITHTLSGSIENEAIRERIAELLEGGYDAFKKREEKYQFLR